MDTPLVYVGGRNFLWERKGRKHWEGGIRIGWGGLKVDGRFNRTDCQLFGVLSSVMSMNAMCV